MVEELKAARERLMRRKDVEHATGFGNLTLRRREQAGLFPKSIKLDNGERRWLQSEVDAWINSTVENARKAKGA
jgi:prophage regulatory protein